MLQASTIPLYPKPRRFERALDVVFPPLCVGCRRVGRWLCEQCWAEAPWLQLVLCTSCQRPWPDSVCLKCVHPRYPLEGIIAVSQYQGAAREAVHALKFHERHAISGMMGRLMAARSARIEVDVVVPIPLHPRRKRERGYDQSDMLARVIGRELGIRCQSRALKRVRRTQQQATLSAGERKANMAGAFTVMGGVTDLAILLVDDVCTTGATLESAARELKDAGAKSVTGLVFAYPIEGPG